MHTCNRHFWNHDRFVARRASRRFASACRAPVSVHYRLASWLLHALSKSQQDIIGLPDEGDFTPTILLVAAVVRRFVGEASESIVDILPNLLKMVMFFCEQKKTDSLRKQLLRVSQDLFFWVLNSPKIVGQYELSSDTCKGILCGATVCDVKIQASLEQSEMEHCVQSMQTRLEATPGPSTCLEVASLDHSECTAPQAP
jgi:hypothetical protein